MKDNPEQRREKASLRTAMALQYHTVGLAMQLKNFLEGERLSAADAVRFGAAFETLQELTPHLDKRVLGLLLRLEEKAGA
jgi:hypothetical protein